jgi:hypothetical protein
MQLARERKVCCAQLAKREEIGLGRPSRRGRGRLRSFTISRTSKEREETQVYDKPGENRRQICVQSLKIQRKIKGRSLANLHATIPGPVENQKDHRRICAKSWLEERLKKTKEEAESQKVLSESVIIATFITKSGDFPISRLFAAVRRADRKRCEFVGQGHVNGVKFNL